MAELSEAIREGRRATVYLREPLPAQGLDAGASARVVAVNGRTVIVRPRGVDDEIPFEAEELRRTKAAPPEPERVKPATQTRKPATKAPAKEAAPKRQPSSPRRTSAGKAGPCAIVLRADEEGEWTLEVQRASGQPLKPVAVQPDAVLRAVQELGHQPATKTVENALSAARAAAARRVEELKQKLEEAKSALQSLEGNG